MAKYVKGYTCKVHLLVRANSVGEACDTVGVLLRDIGQNADKSIPLNEPFLWDWHFETAPDGSEGPDPEEVVLDHESWRDDDSDGLFEKHLVPTPAAVRKQIEELIESSNLRYGEAEEFHRLLALLDAAIEAHG